MPRPRKVRSGGFTLIETLVYLALFVIIVGGIFLIAYAIIELNGRTKTKDMVQEEGDFLLAKLDRSIVGATGVTATATTLTLTKPGPITLVFALNGADLDLQSLPLNNADVKVQNLSFADVGAGTQVESITASFTLSTSSLGGPAYSQDFSTIKYLRK